MTRLIALILLAFCSVSAFAQEDPLMDKITVRRPVDCNDALYSAHLLIPQLHASGKADTLSRLIRYTREKCTNTDNGLLAFEILHAIEKHTFSEELYSDRQNINAFYFPVRNCRRGGVEDSVNRNFEAYISNMAISLHSRQDLSPVEKLLVSYYIAGNESRFDELQSRVYNNTILKALYIKDQQWKSRHSRTYGEVLFGAWLPVGNLARLGIHPGIGIEGGIQGRRLRIGLDLIFYFLNSPNSYLVPKDNVVYNTRHFLGGFMGLNGTYDLVVKNKGDLGLIGGLGYCGFDAVSVGAAPNHVAKSINSFALKTGLSCRRYFMGTYIALSAEYNYVSFRNKGGTDLSGQPFTLTLHLGMVQPHDHKARQAMYN